MSTTQLFTRLCLMIIAILRVAACSDTDEEFRPSGRSIVPDRIVHIYSEDGHSRVTEVRVALAKTEHDRSAGLMNVHELDEDAGMYFIFEDERPRSFWMANTPLSLDMIFIDGSGKIVRIHTRTTPYSSQPVRSDLPARYVLEVNAGFVAEHDLLEGMRVELR